jgi:hypothetical protein
MKHVQKSIHLSFVGCVEQDDVTSYEENTRPYLEACCLAARIEGWSLATFTLLPSGNQTWQLEIH